MFTFRCPAILGRGKRSFAIPSRVYLPRQPPHPHTSLAETPKLRKGQSNIGCMWDPPLLTVAPISGAESSPAENLLAPSARGCEADDDDTAFLA